ncbi:uncharacterized protein LOC123513033 [Portunus trituberculatus]|uniref:uncharacterized protein LOC123513033 n=1 Tax=Portunus trituberculatus TaxID=210409 RepID=UPI001E1D09E4|nr:uncharacterized protein LOC123513033 [Portunus trituberculatus]
MCAEPRGGRECAAKHSLSLLSRRTLQVVAEKVLSGGLPSPLTPRSSPVSPHPARPSLPPCSAGRVCVSQQWSGLIKRHELKDSKPNYGDSGQYSAIKTPNPPPLTPTTNMKSTLTTQWLKVGSTLPLVSPRWFLVDCTN